MQDGSKGAAVNVPPSSSSLSGEEIAPVALGYQEASCRLSRPEGRAGNANSECLTISRSGAWPTWPHVQASQNLRKYFPCRLGHELACGSTLQDNSRDEHALMFGCRRRKLCFLHHSWKFLRQCCSCSRSYKTGKVGFGQDEDTCWWSKVQLVLIWHLGHMLQWYEVSCHHKSRASPQQGWSPHLLHQFGSWQQTPHDGIRPREAQY